MGFIARALGFGSKPKQAPPPPPVQRQIAPEPIVRKQATQAAKSGVIRRQGQTKETVGVAPPTGLFTAGGTAGLKDEELNLQKTMLGG